MALMFHIGSSSSVPSWPKEEMSQGFNAFLDRMLRREVSERSSATELQSDPWLAMEEPQPQLVSLVLQSLRGVEDVSEGDVPDGLGTATP
mmetsp:Transcript_41961/g.91082  ORF Transcript_41961/g.91082 Transcript_41961/m.91082 type:complete len:90 (-) Transcript_41961:43-312(-)